MAEKIAQTGFANLSSLDAGYFGKGIYFGTSTLYILPYFSTKNRPAIIVSYVNMGHVYPAWQDHRDKNNTLLGAIIRGGFNSHYVNTDRRGIVILDDNPKETFDEIVIPQEAQCCPAFIIQFSKKKLTENLGKLMDMASFKRDKAVDVMRFHFG